jgi:archaellum component FlaF (FlaF/FlaG flagellin family)
MKKPSVIFILKCTAILYLSAFTNIDMFTKGKAATPLITKGNCKVQVLGQDEFTAFTFTFNANGTVTAKKDNVQINGLWMEDNIDNKINIRFNTFNPTIQKLNNRWLIKEVTQNQLLIQSNESSNASFVTIASL